MSKKDSAHNNIISMQIFTNNLGIIIYLSIIVYKLKTINFKEYVAVMRDRVSLVLVYGSIIRQVV